MIETPPTPEEFLLATCHTTMIGKFFLIDKNINSQYDLTVNRNL
jgi:hypothetical protein